MAKKTGVNAGIEKGVDETAFDRKVICHKCSKEIEFVLGGKYHKRCPRCSGKLERCFKQEGAEAKKVIKLDILRRSKRTMLSIGFVLTAIALGYNIIGFFTGLFADGQWYFALCSLPLLILSYFCMQITKEKSASKKYRLYARIALIVNFVALAVLVVTAVPYLSDLLHDQIEQL
jgi:hypothetical protein